MKKTVAISIGIFWLLVFIILAGGLVSKNAPAPGVSLQSSQTGGSGVQMVLSMTEVAKHNKLNDCWMLMGNKVYNITAYLPYHPGGAGAILPYCGKDGAAAFNGLPHSQNAANLLASYYLGDLNSSISTNATAASTSGNQNVNTGSRRQDDGEFDN